MPRRLTTGRGLPNMYGGRALTRRAGLGWVLWFRPAALQHCVGSRADASMASHNSSMLRSSTQPQQHAELAV